MRLLTSLVVLGATVSLAACGSSSPARTSRSGPSSSPVASRSGHTDSHRRVPPLVKLAGCLRAHGLRRVADPPPTGDLTGDVRAIHRYRPAQIRAAFWACHAEILSAFHGVIVRAARRAQLRRHLVRFARCMRARFGFRRASRLIEHTSPAFRAALAACRGALPHFGRFRG